MNRRTLLIVSLFLNALLAGIIVWTLKTRGTGSVGLRASPMITQGVVRVEPRTKEVTPSVIEVNAPFHWSQVESTDYRIYIENLRAIGCPELTIYDIVSADVGELFDGKIKKLVDGVTGRFWNLLVKSSEMEKMMEEKRKELGILSEQRDQMMTELFGSTTPADKLAEDEREADKLAYERQMFGFLSAEKIAKVMEIQERHNNAWRTFLEANLNISPKMRDEKSSELEAQKMRELRAVLAPEEFEEYRLRTSGVRNRMINFDGTEAEFRAIAQAKLDSKGDETIRQLLGPERFVGYQRSQDDDFQTTLKITERFALPEETALQIYQMQKDAQTLAKKISGDKTRTVEERQAILQAMRSETEKSISVSLGRAEFKAYLKYNGSWLEQLSRDVR